MKALEPVVFQAQGGLALRLPPVSLAWEEAIAPFPLVVVEEEAVVSLPLPQEMKRLRLGVSLPQGLFVLLSRLLRNCRRTSLLQDSQIRNIHKMA